MATKTDLVDWLVEALRVNGGRGQLYSYAGIYGKTMRMNCVLLVICSTHGNTMFVGLRTNSGEVER